MWLSRHSKSGEHAAKIPRKTVAILKADYSLPCSVFLSAETRQGREEEN